tara:strand:+ start:342 stop:596 length:255 start_codon:yes stop_codon:yes gene_type:complete
MPPESSIVRVLQGIGVGVGHIALPQGHMYTIILVHTAICGVKVSPKSMMGIRFTSTVALKGVTGKIGIIGVGGHQQVNSLITIE